MKRMFIFPLPLLALAISSFGIGTTEYVILGLLPELATDLHVSIPQAGFLVTGYALGVALGSPIIAILTSKMDRRRSLLALMGLFTIGNLMCAVSTSFTLLMFSRIVTSLCHGTFFGIGSVVATEVVPANKKTQAISLMFMGLTLANVLGVPFGTALGQALGWRSTFFVVVLIGIFATLALYVWVPKSTKTQHSSLLTELSAFKNPQVLLAMSISILSSASLFTVFTYITPMLEQNSGATPRQVAIILLILGVALTIGNIIGGILADWRLMDSIAGMLVGVTGVLLILSLTIFHLDIAIGTLFLWGVFAFALISPLQMRVVNEASQAPSFSAILNQGAFNIGNAVGAWAGSEALSAGLAYSRLPIIGAMISCIALLVTMYAKKLEASRQVSI